MRIDAADIETCLADATTGDGAPMSTPIVQTSLFAFPDFDALVTGLSAEHLHSVYTRGQNPTVEALERKLAALERGQACKCFASGMGAVHAVLLGLLAAGDHVVFAGSIYGPTLQLAAHMERFGVTHDIVRSGDVSAVAAALRPQTRLLWLESPGTMLFGVLDLPALAGAARARGVLTCVDNSWATPLCQKPLTLGADIVVHSASKYIGGHSDVMGGAVVTSTTIMQRIFQPGYMLPGALLAPHDAWLLLRGLRTLPLRLARHEADALEVASFLRGHRAVGDVFHPAFTAPPDLVARQLSGWTGVFSFTLRRGDFASVRSFIDALRVFRIGVSWGGVESLVISPVRDDGGAGLARQGLPPGLVRVSIGLEGAELLAADLDQALRAAQPNGGAP